MLKVPLLEGVDFSSKGKAIGLPFSLKVPLLEGVDFPSKGKAIGLPFFLKIASFGRT